MILDRYFSREIWSAFIGFGLVLGGLAWMVQILLLMKLIIKYGVDITGFIGMSFYTFPMLFGIIMPFVAFIAVMFVYNRMIENNEITVSMASGRSPFAIARPAIMVGLIVMAVHLGMNVFILPRSQEAFYSAQWTLRYGLGHLKLKEATFNRMMDGVVIYVEEINQKDLRGLAMRDGRGGGEKIITSESGKLVNTTKGMSIVMGGGGFQSQSSGGTMIGTFDGATMDMDMTDSEDSGTRHARRLKTNELIGALSDIETYPARQRTRIASEAAMRFLAPIMDLLLVLIAAVFLLKTNTLRRRASLAAAYGSFAMVVTMTIFMSVSASAGAVATLYYLGAGELALVIILLWLLRK